MLTDFIGVCKFVEMGGGFVMEKWCGGGFGERRGGVELCVKKWDKGALLFLQKTVDMYINALVPRAKSNWKKKWLKRSNATTLMKIDFF